jgi:protein tyrosine/serine phosphatase
MRQCWNLAGLAWIGNQTAKNFRDLGGYRTSEGHYVRWGLVYRSNHLVNLTARDSEYLNRLGIRLVCDVRSDGERARAPDHWTGNAPEFFSVPIGSNLVATPTADDLKRRVATINSETKDSVRAYISTVRTIITARPETLEATLDKIDKTYGSFDNYLRDALKITDSDLAMIRQCLLEP